jgi:dolichol-phosphate mannosyltransferase
VISIVVPTYREAENLGLLAEAVDEALSAAGHEYELLFIDDDSQDGSEEICAQLAERLPVRIVVRKGERGLATAVIHGISEAKGEIVIVMDADLSHPASAIPAMLDRLQSDENDFVLGSRYVEGGSIHDDWSFFRQLNSIIPSLLAKPLCPLKDPMSGFFSFHRADMPDASLLSPIGYKIALEIYVKGEFDKPAEVPIHFSDRQHGESKLSLKEQLNFLRHLARLYAYKLRPGAGS